MRTTHPTPDPSRTKRELPAGSESIRSVHERGDGALREVVLLMARLGVTAFGGPAAHIAMLRDEVVNRRKWISDQHFLDLNGITNLIPGPNSTEMMMHIGHERAGRRGLVLGGAAFILPAALITLFFAVLYDRYGTTTGGTWLLYGIEPVIIAVVVQAIYGLGRTAIKGPVSLAFAVIIVALYLFGLNELALLFGGAVVWLALRLSPIGTSSVLGALAVALNPSSAVAKVGEKAPSLAVRLLTLPATVGVAAGAEISYSAARLFLTFLKIGSVLYGSGYVLLAFLRNDFVERYGWITEQQLVDAVAVGQFTPGPVFTTATFVGYLVGGFTGAALATIGIFLPAFIFVGLTNPLLPRIRSSRTLSILLDGINLAAIGLMAAVAIELGQHAIVDAPTAVLAIVAAVLLVRYRVNSTWLVVGGGLAGILVSSLGFGA